MSFSSSQPLFSVDTKPLPGIENSALAAPEFRWPKAELPYQISNSFSDSEWVFDLQKRFS